MPIRQVRIRPTADRLEPVLDAIRTELGVPEAFPPEVLAEAAAVAERGPVLPPEVPDSATWVDATDIPFVTIDPPGSRDLDQAFFASAHDDGGFRVQYAIADVAAFVTPDGAIDREARARASTRYQPDRRTPLHPEVLSEGCASLLPNEERPALVWTIDLTADGSIVDGSIGVRRARVRSRRQCTYDEVQALIDAASDGGDPVESPFGELRTIGLLREAQERARGGVSLRLPTQEVVLDAADGRARLAYDAPVAVEAWNAQISLLTGIAAVSLMLDGGIGILRTLPDPETDRLQEFRRQADALGVPWPDDQPYASFVAGLDPETPAGAALMSSAARTLGGADYTAFDGAVPESAGHAAVASTYAHVTAPLRRLVDRFANEVVLALAGGYPVPAWARSALPELPELMRAGRSRERELERAVLDAAEALVLADCVEREFDAVVVSGNGRGAATIQLRDPAVVATLDGRVEPGTALRVRLVEADVATRKVRFVPA